MTLVAAFAKCEGCRKQFQFIRNTRTQPHRFCMSCKAKRKKEALINFQISHPYIKKGIQPQKLIMTCKRCKEKWVYFWGGVGPKRRNCDYCKCVINRERYHSRKEK